MLQKRAKAVEVDLVSLRVGRLMSPTTSAQRGVCETGCVILSQRDLAEELDAGMRLIKDGLACHQILTMLDHGRPGRLKASRQVIEEDRDRISNRSPT